MACLVRLAIAPGAPSPTALVFDPKKAKTSTMSDLWFAEAYDLDDNEVARFCPPPYPAARYAMASWMRPSYPPQLSGEMLFHAGRTEHCWLVSSATATLRTSLAHVAELAPVEWDVPDELAKLPIVGDWVTRTE